MKKILTIVFLSIMISGLSTLFHSCNEESFSTDSTHLLTFSQDTLSFDTVFTTIGSATAQIKVYNPNNKPLLISSIMLANAANSGFKVNIDGQKGTQFADVEIQAKDSMHIFVEVKINPLDRDNPVLIKDSLVFTTNGVKQDVKLMAYGQDVIILKGKTINRDSTFTSNRPILIYDSLKVSEGANLNCEAGTKLYFHDKANLLLHGTINAQGTLGNPVLFRGDRLDKMFTNLPYDRVPGQWGGIHIYSGSYNNRFDYADIHSGKYGILCDSSAVDQNKLEMTNSIVHNVEGDGLSLISCKAAISNCQITNAGKNCVNLLGGDYTFTHCTIADFYSWGIRKGVALTYSNYNGKIDYPVKASFYNCLITGTSADEIAGSKSDKQNVSFDYYFSHSLINSKEEPASDVLVNITWAKENKFIYIGKDDFRYDFRPDSLNKAINIADPEIARNYPYDLNGRYRLKDGKPDAGCYEWESGDK
ncbi:right-handed parallel beta-helix repeat-containing protein [Bacteroides sedimenti]|uniref:Right-handed parallel beta-helix repeat-containing protein n=1 Tax=Bacteroides sedimenti TaxID=2136147 RepID=A0ABN6Z2B9_9BACE